MTAPRCVDDRSTAGPIPRRAHQTSKRLLAAALALAAMGGGALPARASWEWLPAVQVTHSDGATLGACTGEGTAGRTSGVVWHQLIRTWEDSNPNHGLGYYVRIAPGWAYDTAWAGSESVTPAGHTVTDLSMTVDANDEVYFGTEVHGGFGDGQPRIGYRHRDSSGEWSAPWIVSPDSINYGAASPNLFLQEADGDTVHLFFVHANDTLNGTWYTRHATTESDSIWEAASFLTSSIGPNIVRVDDDGIVHLFGKGAVSCDTTPCDAPDTTIVWHFFGPHPSPGNPWALDSVYVAKYPMLPDQGEGPGQDPPPADLGGMLSNGGTFDWAFAVPTIQGGENVSELFLAHGDVTGHNWTTPYHLTDADRVDDFAPEVTASENGLLHLVYHEGSKPSVGAVGPTKLFHRVTTDPTDSTLWSPRMELTADNRSINAQRPRIFAKGDTLWMMYTSHDDDDSGDDDYEVWARRGYKIDDRLPADSAVTWRGLVYLDADYVVEEGASLTIAPGTKVFALASSGEEKVHLIILGHLIAVGDEENPITFASYDGEGAPGEWGGIVFDVGVDGAASRIEYAEIRGAWIGVRLDAVAPSLIHVAFSESSIADIMLERDTRIAAGSEWNLDAPTRVVAFGSPLSEDTLGTDGYLDLIVAGSLVTQRPPGAAAADSVVFESVAKDSMNGADWAGITIAAGGVGLLHDCDIGFGLRGVYFAAADSAELVDSHVHHYSEEGVFDYASDALIQGCRIDRGLADTDIHTAGIRASSSVPSILDNEIGWQTDFGIWVGFGKWVCAQPFWGDSLTVSIAGNIITGDDGTNNREPSAAMRAEYVCYDYAAIIDGNTVKNWQGRAIELFQDADVLLQCNAFDSSFAGAEYYRDDQVLQSYEGFVSWKQNSLKRNLKVNLDVLQDVGLRLYDAAGSGAAAGQNSFRRSADQPNISNIAFKGDSGDSSDARGQSWFRANGTLISDVAAVDSTNTAGKGVILVDPLLSSEQLCSQGATARQSGGTTAPAPGGIGTATAAEAESAVPDRWAVEVTGANPNTGPVGLVLAVPVPGTVRVVVFDVAGRRVRVLQDGILGVGFHHLTWNRTRDDGGRVASGVYFLRVDAGSFRETRKVVLLQSGG